MELVYQVATLFEIDEIYGFAEERLKIIEPDETARVFRGWNSRWRREALEYYLPRGWSFTARRKAQGSGERGVVVGFFLAQPFIFVRGMTQTLWVEHLEADSNDVSAGLLDVALRLAREKHLQRVLLAEPPLDMAPLARWPHHRLSDEIIEIATTKG